MPQIGVYTFNGKRVFFIVYITNMLAGEHYIQVSIVSVSTIFFSFRSTPGNTMIDKGLVQTIAIVTSVAILLLVIGIHLYRRRAEA